MTQKKPYNNLKFTEEDMLDIFSANIHYLRKLPRWNLSQKTLARILHIPTKSYRKYELGRGFPPVFVVYHLAVYFGYTMEELLTEKLF